MTFWSTTPVCRRTRAFDEMTLAQWNKVIGVNLTGQFLCAREAVREFKRRGMVPEVSLLSRQNHLHELGSEVIPWAGHVNYAASKGGVMLMMKSLAQEVAPYRSGSTASARERSARLSTRRPGKHPKPMLS